MLVDLPPGGDLGKAESLLDEELAKVVSRRASPTRSCARRRTSSWRTSGATWRPTAAARRRWAPTRCSTATGQKLFDAPARYEAVTREQVQKVAARCSRANNRTVGVLVPEAGDEAKKEAAR